MDLRGRRRSSNVQDRRGAPRSGRVSTGRSVAGGGIGVIVLALVAMFFGVDPSMVLNLAGGAGGAVGTQQQAPIGGGIDDEGKRFVSQVLGSTEDVWTTIFRQSGETYPAPTLVLFETRVSSACGTQSSATGPFYCPADRQVYIDLGFFDQLSKRFGAKGDFAAAYVIAHEVGHHLQTVLGISNRVRELKRGKSKPQQNDLSVRQELQADCFAGIWGHHADQYQGILSRGDLQEALRAAEVIGDDNLQRQAGRAVAPESFTHGSSAQRQRWFLAGFESGSVQACDTLSARNL